MGRRQQQPHEAAHLRPQVVQQHRLPVRGLAVHARVQSVAQAGGLGLGTSVTSPTKCREYREAALFSLTQASRNTS